MLLVYFWECRCRGHDGLHGLAWFAHTAQQYTHSLKKVQKKMFLPLTTVCVVVATVVAWALVGDPVPDPPEPAAAPNNNEHVVVDELVQFLQHSRANLDRGGWLKIELGSGTLETKKEQPEEQSKKQEAEEEDPKEFSFFSDWMFVLRPGHLFVSQEELEKTTWRPWEGPPDRLWWFPERSNTKVPREPKDLGLRDMFFDTLYRCVDNCRNDLNTRNWIPKFPTENEFSNGITFCSTACRKVLADKRLNVDDDE